VVTAAFENLPLAGVPELPPSAEFPERCQVALDSAGADLPATGEAVPIVATEPAKFRCI
jgi:hypothetical protein